MKVQMGVKERHVKSYSELMRVMKRLGGQWRPWDDMHRHMCGFMRDVTSVYQIGWVGIRVEPHLRDSALKGEMTKKEAKDFSTPAGRVAFAERMSA